MASEQVDQDSLAAEWGVALEAEQKSAKVPGNGTGADLQGSSGAEAMAVQWANMAEDGQFSQSAKGGSERILTQEGVKV
jgi:hypothetical protein